MNRKTKAQEAVSELIQQRSGENQVMRAYLERHNRPGMNRTAFVRRLCSFTDADWELYEECCEYEVLANRDEEDKTLTSALGGEHGTLKEWSSLLESQFNNLKAESESKKLTYENYLWLRYTDLYEDNKHGFLRFPLNS